MKERTYYERNKEHLKAYQRTYYAGLTLAQRSKRSEQDRAYKARKKGLTVKQQSNDKLHTSGKASQTLGARAADT